ncbi:MAG: transglutaminase family protein [Lachnospiraceae bacterium]
MRRYFSLFCLCLFVLLTSGCANRSNTFHPAKKVLEPAASGRITYGNNTVTIDASYSQNGYIMVKYTGSNQKPKLQITGSDAVTHTYDLHDVYESFPLTSGNGIYHIMVFEHIKDYAYTTNYETKLNVRIADKFDPYLYPNQYVFYTKDSETVKKAAEFGNASSDQLDFINRVYHYVTTQITYDYKKAETVQSGYLPNVDDILHKKRGICFDYSVLMAAMLRSQGIPTRLEIGYAGDEYHSWLRVYTEETGRIGKSIQANAHHWTLIDPTFAASDENESRDFLKDASNYKVTYMY